jgi:hypothetical protein
MGNALLTTKRATDLFVYSAGRLNLKSQGALPIAPGESVADTAWLALVHQLRSLPHSMPD